MRQVRLTAGYAAVRRTGTPVSGERLAVYDLRRGRRTLSERLVYGGRYTQLLLVGGGVVESIATLPATASGSATVIVSATNAGWLASGPGIDPRFLRTNGAVVAWRRGPIYEVGYGGLPLVRQRLLRIGGFHLDVITGPERYAYPALVASLGATGPRVRVGQPANQCVSPDCGGVDAVRRAGHFLAVRSFDYNHGHESAVVHLYDLSARSRRLACSEGKGAIAAFVVTDTGAGACAIRRTEDPGPNGPTVRRIEAEGEVLDEGPGIDLASLDERGGHLVWLHDGTERTAPLPSPPPGG